MQYRKFGKNDLEVSALGFGMMRLPVLNNDQSQIDYEQTRQMVRYAVDHGVNYIDTAYPYHQGQSEVVVGRILEEEHLREKVNLATKCPTWLVEKREDFDRFLDEQLQKLRTDHIDMYLLHSLEKKRWETLLKAQVFDFLEKAKSDGRIRFAGFSFHDDVSIFKSIVNSYNWDLCQIQYNYMDEAFQAGTEGLKYASGKGLAVVVMEPLRGGQLAQNVPDEILSIWRKWPVKRSPAEWGLRWVLNHPEVSVVLSGMGSLEQVKENVNTAQDAFPGRLTPEELELFEEVKRVYAGRTKVRCTACHYCVPCPQGISIPDWFRAYNEAHMFGRLQELAGRYPRLKENMGDPGSCLECGNCESSCPQHLPIREYLKEIRAALSTCEQAST